ncbi:MAG: hypothetical protein U9Q62_09690 [Campylobacterota bacterium]|nr:hypothetical protein [Campylobacterota bacterium]
MLKNLLLLIPLLGGVGLADTYSVSTKWLESTLKYNVKDPNRQLEAELEFPAEAVAIALGYTHDFQVGSLSFSVEHSIYSNDRTGKDTDWHQGETTVYSESNTELDKYFNLGVAYDYPLLDSTAIGIELFHEEWKMTWSDTKQTSYYNNQYVEVSGSTVTYQQKLDGVRFYLGYENDFSGIPWRLSAGYDIAYIDSKDQHLLRSFYTSSQDWIDGYHVDLTIELFHYNSSLITMGGSYRKVEGDADMDFHHDNGEKYMTLPANYETIVKTFEFQYSYRF